MVILLIESLRLGTSTFDVQPNTLIDDLHARVSSALGLTAEHHQLYFSGKPLDPCTTVQASQLECGSNIMLLETQRAWQSSTGGLRVRIHGCLYVIDKNVLELCSPAALDRILQNMDLEGNLHLPITKTGWEVFLRYCYRDSSSSSEPIIWPALVPHGLLAAAVLQVPTLATFVQNYTDRCILTSEGPAIEALVSCLAIDLEAGLAADHAVEFSLKRFSRKLLKSLAVSTDWGDIDDQSALWLLPAVAIAQVLAVASDSPMPSRAQPASLAAWPPELSGTKLCEPASNFVALYIARRLKRWAQLVSSGTFDPSDSHPIFCAAMGVRLDELQHLDLLLQCSHSSQAVGNSLEILDGLQNIGFTQEAVSQVFDQRITTAAAPAWRHIERYFTDGAIASIHRTVVMVLKRSAASLPRFDVAWLHPSTIGHVLGGAGCTSALKRSLLVQYLLANQAVPLLNIGRQHAAVTRCRSVTVRDVARILYQALPHFDTVPSVLMSHALLAARSDRHHDRKLHMAARKSSSFGELLTAIVAPKNDKGGALALPSLEAHYVTDPVSFYTLAFVCIMCAAESSASSEDMSITAVDVSGDAILLALVLPAVLRLALFAGVASPAARDSIEGAFEAQRHTLMQCARPQGMFGPESDRTASFGGNDVPAARTRAISASSGSSNDADHSAVEAVRERLAAASCGNQAKGKL